ncbi:MAG TPA: hypothetical protein VLM37_02855 [Fibrobacteraceae bacterium]|nr:hypothetical protein [Fibrobacteraceae bacterium]
MPPEQPLTDVTYAECERMYSTDITLLREPYRTRYVAQKTRCLEEARRYENYRQQQSQIKEDPHGGRTLALILLGIIALPITIWALTR